MAYIPETGSVISFQPPGSIISASIKGGNINVNNFPTNQNVSGSVVAFQGTNPFIITGSVQTTVTPAANQSVSGTVNVGNFPGVTSLVSTVPSSVIVGASIFGLPPVNVTNTNLNVAGSVVTFQGTDPWRVTHNNGSVITVSQGSVATVIVGGSIATAVTPFNSSVQVLNFPTNQNVSGSVVQFQGGTQITSLVSTVPSSVLVGASIFGTVPVTQVSNPWIITGSVQTTVTTGNSSVQVLNFPTNQSISGAVTQGTNPWIMTGSVQGNMSVLGTVPVTQSTSPWIITGSVQGSFSPAANQSVSGTVHVDNFSSVIAYQLAGSILATSATVNPAANQSVSGTVGASVIGHAPVVIVGGSILTSSTPNQSVSGTVNVGNFPGITSLVSTVPSSVIVGASIFGLPPVNVTNTNLNVSGSVAAWLQSTNASIITVGGAAGNSSVQVLNFPANQSVSGTVGTTQVGTWITSLVSTVPSSVIVGASIFGLAPVNVTNTNLNVGGSVVAFQGTSPWVIQSIVGTYAEDAGFTGSDKGIFTLGVRNDTVTSFVSADLDYTPIALDSTGRTVVKPFAPEESTFSYTGSVVSGSVTLIKASAVGKRVYITDYWVSNTGSVATLVTFQDGSTSVVGYTIAPGNGGSNAPGLAVPLHGALSQDMAFKMTTMTSVLYMTVSGYQAP